MDVPVVFSSSTQSEGRYIDLMKWGLIPSHAKTFNTSDHYKMFNARIESVSEKVSFKNLLPKKRCIVLFNGYYEWKGTPGHKTPYYVSLGNDQPMMMAALFDISSSGLESFTILTRDSCPALKSLHDRQPVFLSTGLVDIWLNVDIPSAKALQSLSQLNYSDFDIQVREVDKRMTNSKYQGSDCSSPIKPPKQPQLAEVFSKSSSSPSKAQVASSSSSSSSSSAATSCTPISCPICQEDITMLSLQGREDHVYACLSSEPDDDGPGTGQIIYEDAPACKKQRFSEI
jgi:putative SOS response-associated peptidase YedK